MSGTRTNAGAAPTGAELRTMLERAYVELGRRRAEIDALERARHEPVAVVGYACRFPGGCDDGGSFWRLLADGREARAEVPRERWDPDALDVSHLDERGRAAVRYGHFLRDVESFDAPFFNLSPREARAMDPQQRLLLELAWEALEHANLPAAALRGTPTGVFAGLTCFDHALLLQRSQAGLGAHAGTGGALNVAAGRIAYLLGLNGPCCAVDTACSSALVALHAACASLRQRECDTALAGGVLLMLSGEVMSTFAQAQMLAPDGRCKTFDQSADGYARGEGGAVVVLRRLSDARAAGDRVLGLIRGSAVNHAGASGGLTVPSARSQEQVLRAALQAARTAPDDVDYVEAHGTGTPLGDPLELDALGAVYGAGRGRTRPLLVGSVKTNIGHLEPASGLAGLVKLLLAFEHGHLPPHLHFRTPSTHVPWDRLGVEVLAQGRTWPRTTRPRVAGLSAFGFSGTNVHVIVEEPPAAETAETAETPEREWHVLPLSARTPAALAALGGRYRDLLTSRADAPLGPIARSAAQGRGALEERLAVVAHSPLMAAAALAEGAAPRAAHRGRRAQGEQARVAFVFSGLEPEWSGAGRDLYAEPAFRAALERCAAALDGQLERPLVEAMYSSRGAPDPLDGVLTQAALMALQVALAELWRAWGVEPSMVLGHGAGECAAAVVSGAAGLEDGLRFAIRRARLMQALPHAGQGDAVEALADELSAAGVAWARLPGAHVEHSPLVQPVLDGLERAAADVAWQAPRLRVVSGLTGRVAGAGDLAQASYWARQAREPVRFAQGLATLVEEGAEVVVEIGPRAALTARARRGLRGRGPLCVPSLRGSRDAVRTMLEAVAGCWAKGVEVDWRTLLPGSTRPVTLPGYPFERTRCTLRDEGARVAAGTHAPRRGADAAQLQRRLAENGHWSAQELALVPRLLDELARLDADEPGVCAYRLAWEPSAVSDGASASHADGAPCLVLCDEADGTGLGTALADELARAGRAASVVHVAHEDPAAPGVLDLRRVDAFPRLLAEARARGDAAPGLVVYLCGPRALDASTGAAGLERALEPALRGALHVVQALARERARGARLWLVTRDAVPAGEPPALTGLAHAPLWGLGQAALLEFPDVVAGLVDLDARPVPGEAARLAQTLCRRTSEPCVAWRGERRYVPRVVRAGEFTGAPARLDGAAAYLVTGGLGVLGLRVARWLAGRGARRLVLLGRRAPGDDARRAVDELSAGGAQVSVVSADVCDEAELRRALDPFLPTLRGVVHAAGAPGYAPLHEIDADTLAQVTRAKTLGSFNLHRLTAPLRLDFFIGFASIASVWGARMQAHYAAGSAFLDALAHHRRAQGLAALSVDWGPWAEGGMTTPEAATLLRRVGVETLPPAAALRALEGLLDSGLAQAALARVDWRRFKDSYEAVGQRTLLERLDGETSATTAPAARLARFEGLRGAERSAAVEGLLREELAAVLALPRPDAIDPERGLFTLGLDSLTALEFRRRLEAALGRALPASLVFDHPDLRALTQFVLREALPRDEAPAGDDGSLDAALAKVASLSEDEAAEALLRRLGQLAPGARP